MKSINPISIPNKNGIHFHSPLHKHAILNSAFLVRHACAFSQHQCERERKKTLPKEARKKEKMGEIKREEGKAKLFVITTTKTQNTQQHAYYIHT